MGRENRTDWNMGRSAESKFNGNAKGYFGLCLLCFVLVVFTLGFGTPWAICKMYRWRCNNLVIDGKQVVFEGKGKKLFWRYLGWCILSIITIGIYGLRVPVKLQDWLTERTHFVRSENEPYLGDLYTKSRFCGITQGYLCLRIAQITLIIFTLGIALPWVICKEQRWRIDNMIIDGRQLVFAGKGKRLFWRHLVWLFVTILTLGVGSFWMHVKLLKWEAKNTHFA